LAFDVLDIAETCGIRIADREIAFKGGSAGGLLL
jgi:hypothetical protein